MKERRRESVDLMVAGFEISVKVDVKFGGEVIEYTYTTRIKNNCLSFFTLFNISRKRIARVIFM